MLTLIQLLGRILALLPEKLLRGLCTVFGAVIYSASGERRQTALRNLHHCFPEKDDSWRRKILREHCRRLVEMTLYVLALPFLTKKRVRRQIEPIEEEALKWIVHANRDVPALILTPHFTLSEATTTLPLHFKPARDRFSVIYRPLNSPKLNDWVTQTRSRFGVELLSRKSGFSTALKRLESKQGVALLFDQSAGSRGSYIHFMDRVVSATELPGLMALRKQAEAYIMYAERTGFWRARFNIRPLEVGVQPIDLTLAANEWLANYLKSSDDRCADWLWLHDRWGSPKNPKRRFHLKRKRDRLAEDSLFRKGAPIRRTTTVCFFLPETEADYLDLADILKAIRKSRPDYAICLVSETPEESLSTRFGLIADRTVTLSRIPKERKHQFKCIAEEYPDVWINLRRTRTSLVESSWTRAPQRFGMKTVKHARKYLTDLAPAPNEDSWMPFFRYFGLGTRKKHKD